MKILFVIDSLSLGGAEKSLITLLNCLDYNKYEVYLQLFSIKGEFLDLVPKEVKILPILSYYSYCKISYKNFGKKIKHLNFLISQLRYSLRIRLGKYNHTEKSVLFWKICGNCFAKKKDKYDVAIAYSQGVPTFYVASKINADKKFSWINATYLPTGETLKYISKCYDNYSNVICVSEFVYSNFRQKFPEHEEKGIIINDILDKKYAKKMADDYEPDEYKYNSDVKILSVGRLIYEKGFDLAADACILLRNYNINFKWYVIGDGDQRGVLKQKIFENNIEDYFVLLGPKSNPYPYFKKCDIYVQPSRFEGFGISIAEAKMFNKPILVTNFECVGLQIVNEYNGIIVNQNAQDIANGIIRILKEKGIRENLVNNLKREEVTNFDEINKFYEILNL